MNITTCKIDCDCETCIAREARYPSRKKLIEATIRFPQPQIAGSQTFLQRLCEVQPMSPPSGLIFYFDYKYGQK